MNPFVVDPEWGWWIIFYFFLGGIAAGAYFTAALIDFVGSETDRDTARVGYFIAFPLIVVCGVLLILDLSRPERFWHMMLKSEVVHASLDEGWPWSGQGWSTMSGAPILKFWSPMSIGAWALALFGLCSSLSVLGSLQRDGRLARWFRRGVLGRTLQVVGSAVGFFVAAYTGALLTATNQPLWSDSSWIAALFLTSAASTGIATLLLFSAWRGRLPGPTRSKLERADLWVIALELLVFAAFLVSVSQLVGPLLELGSGRVLLIGVGLLGILVPLGLQLSLRLAKGAGRKRALAASVAALAGGFLLRYALVTSSPALGEARPDVAARSFMGTPAGLGMIPQFGPEDGRNAGERGADPANRTGTIRGRSKVFTEP